MSRSAQTPWLIRLALTAFPRPFREAHAAEMEEDFVEARSKCSSRMERLGLTAATAVDLVTSGIRERRAGRVRGGAPSRDERSQRQSRRGMADQLVRDLRHAVRALARRPGFSLVAVTTLALGIGANTAIFSVVNAVLLRPLEWLDPDGLVHVWTHDGTNPNARGSMSVPDIQDVAQLGAVETMVGFRSRMATVTGGEEPDLVSMSRSTNGLMQTFRVRPLMGRDLTADDEAIGRPPVVVVGYRYWQDRLGARPDVLGSTIELDHVTHEVVGIAPAGFDFPDGAQLWAPWQLDTEGCGRGCHLMQAIGRLADGTTLDLLNAQLGALAARLSVEYPESNARKQFRGVRLADNNVADVRRGLWFILGAVSLVLLIACANVANLLLVRGEGRRGEVAVRTALGASRGQLASQVLMESAVLATVGAAVGLGLARAAIVLIRAMPEGTVPRIETVSLDANVLWFTLGLSLIVTLLFGLTPALRQARGQPASELISARRGGSGPAASRSRSLLLTVEVALSVVLLAGAGLLLKSFDRLYSTDLGFGTEQLTRFRVSLPEARYDSISRIVTFYETLEQQLAALPGVTAVASGFGPPLGAGRISADLMIEGRPVDGQEVRPSASIHSVTPTYFETMRIPVLRGRGIEPGDRTGTLPVAVVSQSLVNEHFPGEDPIGRRIEVSADFGYGSPVWTIVGVAGDVRRSPTAAHEAMVYVPLSQYGPGGLTVAMRTAGPAAPTVSDVRDVMRGIDPGLSVIRYESVDQALRAVVAPTRFYTIVMGVFAALALTLACVGLYGVVAYVVSQRNREIGIRMALGARREQVIRQILGQGMVPAAAGILLGVGLALTLGRVAESLLFDVSPRDPVVLAAVVGVLSIVAFTAALLPARRASRVDPARVLREQ